MRTLTFHRGGRSALISSATPTPERHPEIAVGTLRRSSPGAMVSYFLSLGDWYNSSPSRSCSTVWAASRAAS